jgi:hypothetical protein
MVVSSNSNDFTTGAAGSFARTSAGLTTSAAPSVALLPKNFRRVKRARLVCSGADPFTFVIAFLAPQKFSFDDSVAACVSSGDVSARYNAAALSNATKIAPPRINNLRRGARRPGA